MLKPTMPRDQDEWDKLTAALLRAHLELKGMNQIDLQRSLSRMGIEQSTKNISGKLRHGRFSATFFLQTLVAMDVKHLELPERDESNG